MAAALREVMEETGINMINISEKVGETYHVYYEDDILLLKETHWYLMNSTGKGTLKPQMEEGISEVKFANLDWFDSAEFNSYQSVHDVIRRCLALRSDTNG
jgi:8-oxo-dGTP pyrophosphatase MutT (NUDIX family)